VNLPVPLPTPAPVRRAGLLVAVEGAALAVVGVVYAVSGVVGAPEDRLGTVLQGAIGVLVGLALLAVARGLHAGRGWAWAPAITVQLFLVVVGVGLAQGHVWAAAVPVLLLAAGVLSQLAAPQARASYRTDDERPGG